MGVSGVFQAVNRGDIRVIERGEDLGFACEAGHALKVARKNVGQDFEGYVSTELRISRAVNLPHPACAERLDNVIRAELAT